MKPWKYPTIVHIFQLLRLLLMCFAAYDDCSWVIDVIEKANFSKAASVILPGGQYFLRLRVKCNDMITSETLRSLVLTGVNPLVKIETEAFGVSHYETRIFSFVLTAALMEMGDQANCGCTAKGQVLGNSRMEQCNCDRTQPCCSKPETVRMVTAGQKCCQVVANCSSFSELCNPAWIVPLPMPDTVATLHCEVIDSGIGPFILSPRFTVQLDGFHVFINNTVVNAIGDKAEDSVPFLSHPIPVSCVLSTSSTCIITSSEISSKVIYTASEFENMEVLEIQAEDAVENICTSALSSSTLVIKEAFSLPDRIILNTGAGVLELQANYKDVPSSMRDKLRVLRRCISHIIGPAQSALHSATVLGIGEEQDKGNVFLASLIPGSPLNFIELRDSQGNNFCGFLITLVGQPDISACQVVTGSANGVKKESLILLVKLSKSHFDTFHLVEFQGPANSGRWNLLFHFPASLDFQEETEGWQILESQLNVDTLGSQALTLSGLSFTAIVSGSLFIWGNVLLYSPDGGESIHWFTGFPGNSKIMLFTSSPFDGTYAVLTDTQQVWVGQVGSSTIQRLKSTVELWDLVPHSSKLKNSSVVSLFFDSDNRLQQLVAEKTVDETTSCLSRVELPLASLIAQEVFFKGRKEIIDLYFTDTSNRTSCLKKQSSEGRPLNVVQRACPFVSVVFAADHDALFTRKCFYKFEPSTQYDSGLVRSNAALHDYFSRVHNTVNGDCTGIYTKERQTFRGFLPKQIFLGRSGKYSFVFYLHQDFGMQPETSTHAWNVSHLKASLRLSNASVLNLTSQRTEQIPQKMVRYEVTVQDAGLRLPQYPSGEGLTPISLYIQVWNSLFKCTDSYGEGGVLQGSHVMTVLLGCPAGLKLMFDPEASKNASGKQHYCSSHDDVPCFLYDRDFIPVFKVLDLANGHESQFSGNYGLKIVGGGPTRQSLIDYTEQQQETYNFEIASSMASLIWAPKVKTLGDIPVFNKTTSGLRWLCASQSPCSEVRPSFPQNAKYYFKLEFSNRIVDADSSNCDFTFQFVIRVHGLPPGSLNPSSVVVLSCIGVLGSLVMSFYALKRKNAKLCGQVKGLGTTAWELLRARIPMRRNRRTVPCPESIPMEPVTEVTTQDCNLDSETMVSVVIRGSTTDEQHEKNKNV